MRAQERRQRPHELGGERQGRRQRPALEGCVSVSEDDDWDDDEEEEEEEEEEDADDDDDEPDDDEDDEEDEDEDDEAEAIDENVCAETALPVAAFQYSLLSSSPESSCRWYRSRTMVAASLSCLAGSEGSSSSWPPPSTIPTASFSAFASSLTAAETAGPFSACAAAVSVVALLPTTTGSTPETPMSAPP